MRRMRRNTPIAPFVIALSVLSLCQCILLPVSTNKDRCMIVYSSGDDQTAKVQLDLPQIPGNGEGDHYLITFKDTQTNDVTYDTISVGKYKKELTLNKVVIYELCISLRSRQHVTDLLVDYEARTQFYFDHAQVKVPQSLLKSQDLNQAFQLSYQLGKLSQSFKQHQQIRSQSNDKVFAQTTQISDRLLMLSLLELGAVIITGVMQYFLIKRHLVNKQYI